MPNTTLFFLPMTTGKNMCTLTSQNNVLMAKCSLNASGIILKNLIIQGLLVSSGKGNKGPDSLLIPKLQLKSRRCKECRIRPRISSFYDVLSTPLPNDMSFKAAWISLLVLGMEDHLVASLWWILWYWGAILTIQMLLLWDRDAVFFFLLQFYNLHVLVFSLGTADRF